MRRALIVSFDLIRTGEPEVALSTASLLAHLRHDPAHGKEFEVAHLGFNLLDFPAADTLEAAQEAICKHHLGSLDTIALSCYVWCEPIVKGVISRLRKMGFRGKIVLGGYQISYASREELPSLYPGADIFISGYAEASLREALLMDRPPAPVVLAEEVDFQQLPSPYLGNDLPISDGQAMVRLESKRGCPFRCSFCNHRDLKRNEVHRHPLERLFLELEFLKAKGVGKVNFLDPVFNQGKDYLLLMQHMADIQFRSLVAFQTRFELIRGEEGTRFLDLAQQLNVELEFGLQTAVESESRTINRRNRPDAIRDVMRQLGERKIPYEVSLIYGLPGQTVDSFRQSIDFLRENGCERIVAFPLMLLRGTELFAQRERWEFKERPMGDFGIPVVYESATFSEGEWQTMRDIADQLSPHQRV